MKSQKSKVKEVAKPETPIELEKTDGLDRLWKKLAIYLMIFCALQVYLPGFAVPTFLGLLIVALYLKFK